GRRQGVGRVIRVSLAMLILLALTFSPIVHATCVQTEPSTSANNGSWACSDQGEAFAKASSMGVPADLSVCRMKSIRAVSSGPGVFSQRMTYPGDTCGIGYDLDIGTGNATYPDTATCAKRPSQSGWTNPTAPTPSDVCNDGCYYTYAVDAGGPKGYTYVPSGATCTTDDAAPPIDDGGDGDDDGGGDGGGDG
ncbi:attachment protein, partial [Xanthomonas campestris pv. campestris]|nr:attachment protein [Xanthomonas campestris pv. campestris]MDM7619783.1 attachment protein [Xanthomonas campestris pv. campestris]MDM7623986.1 attachment protein [Xanthomonas campestris pv. campestris]MDM7632376.1 attachment protein [Xanthomonas campestris pv. campestris]MDM7636585.1 attachment protein [Xanthomonas campestris pv. campestris]